MDSEENYTMKSSVKVNFKKKISKRCKHVSSSSDSSSDSVCDEISTPKKNKKRMKSLPKKRIHTAKHKHRKTRNRSSSSDSSSSEDTSTSSSSDTNLSSSSSEEKKRKKRKHKLEKLNKLMKKPTPSLILPKVDDGPSNNIPLELMGKGRSMAPMTKEEWEKKQNVVRRVYDESTGRHRLIKGDGEVIEEIVSQDRHKLINQQATKGDGDFFQKQLNQL